MYRQLERFAIAAANIFLIASLVIFAKGFFPHKASLPGFAQWPADSLASSRAAPFDRVVFMVVDALRSDFVFGNSSGFQFTQSLIRNGAAIPFTGYASAPTITMPRVKAITTGSVPSFVDMLLNFAESDTTSTLKDQDSWLAQIRAKGGKLVMYGDDTWLRLFPGFFERSDGTTSFFVSDFTEVDNNVTRHIPLELENDDWSAMTLHFLGLDHIGHKTGPRGPNMPAKQSEMDGIVKDIYTAMESKSHLKSCLLVLLGDHGMNEGGNHGASSAGEVSTALTFISPKFKTAFEGQTSPITDAVDYRFYDTVQQSDIAPTLAALLGFPVPQNNLGIIIPRLLELWTVQTDQYDLLYANAEQIHHIAEATFPNQFKQGVTSDGCSATGDDATALACLWHRVSQSHSGSLKGSQNHDSTEDIKAFLHKAQSSLSGAASNYGLTDMYIGIGLAGAGLLCCLPTFAQGAFQAGADGLFLVSVMVIYAITMFATSYVEEEHQFWYWILGGWLILLYLKGGRFSSKGVFSGRNATFTAYVLLGIVRRWRQTGQKYAGDPDLLTEIIAPNSWFLWVLVTVTYALPSRNLSARAATWMESRRMGVLPVLVTISAFLFKLAFTAADAPELLQTFPIFNPMLGFVSKYPLVKMAQVVFLGLAHLAACAIYYEAPWKDIHHFRSFLSVFQNILTIFMATQSRTVFVPLFLFFTLQLSLLRRARQAYSIGEVTATALLVQYASFFTLGGTNSIATVDLSNAYNGISGYNVFAVGILTFISNWTGPIWWSFGVLQLLSDADLRKGRWSFLLAGFATFACVHTLAVMVACTMLREHLFIWTVFSPKYLYTAAWVVGQHTFVNTIAVGALLWQGGRGSSS